MLNKLDSQIVNLMSLKLEKNKYSAFTLIELLVVIAIIAILSTFSVITLSSARDKARDAKRLSDVRNITTALEMYYNDSGVYPPEAVDMYETSTIFCLSNQGISSTCGAVVYAGSLPTDPVSGLNYLYTPTSSQLFYTVAFTLDSGAGGYESGDYIATPEGTRAWVCGDSVTFTYNNAYVTYGTVSSSNECWLDRNLGANRVAIASDDYQAYGDLFQWGRPADGHQLINWALESPVNGTSSGPVANVAPGIEEFLISSSDWSNFDTDGSLRQANWGVNGLSNPCPTGFRIPRDDELEEEMGSWNSPDSADAFNSPLKLPVAGFRDGDSGSLNGFSSYGTYWSSTINDIHSPFLYFRSDYAGVQDSHRADGMSVRCLKD
jgi:prepilin-type N-terminal cleavage/methylation domain-containing protein